MAHQPTNKAGQTPVGPETDESFVQRWSRLKEEARATPSAKGDATTPPPGAGSPSSDCKQDDKPPVESKPFDISQLPPIENLTKESDFSLFMRPEVPDEMRNKALRRLWALDAALAQPDWLEMYMVDFNDVPTFPEGLKNTLYQVGKGYIDKIDADAKVSESRETSAEPAAASARQAGERQSGSDRDESVKTAAADSEAANKPDS